MKERNKRGRGGCCGNHRVGLSLENCPVPYLTPQLEKSTVKDRHRLKNNRILKLEKTVQSIE